MSDLILVATLGDDVEPLLRSIDRHCPSQLLIAGTKNIDGLKTDLLEQSELQKNQVSALKLEDKNDPVSVADQIGNYFIQHITIDENKIIADFTGGEKPTPAGLVLFAQEYEDVELGLMTKLGPQQETTEPLFTWRTISFDRMKLKMNVRQAQEALDSYQFEEMKARLRDAAELQNISPDEREILHCLIQVAIGYDCWDRGLFQEAHNILKREETGRFVRERNGYLDYLVRIRQQLDPSCDSAEMDDNLDLEQLKKPNTPDPFLLAGEFVKSARRRKGQDRLDEAVARLYRAIEMIIQTALTVHTQEYTSAFPEQKLPEDIDIGAQPSDGMLKLGLEDSFQVYSGIMKNDKKRHLAGFWEENKAMIRNCIGHRNFSLLAHGFRPIKDTAVIDEGLKICNDLLDSARQEFSQESQYQSVKPDLDTTLMCELNQVS